MGLVWLEAMLPLGIIAGMLCVMGNAQYQIHKAAHGRVRTSLVFTFQILIWSYLLVYPYWFLYVCMGLAIGNWQPKHIGNDDWDVAMEKRDKKIIQMLSSSSPSIWFWSATLCLYLLWYCSCTTYIQYVISSQSTGNKCVRTQFHCVLQ